MEEINYECMPFRASVEMGLVISASLAWIIATPKSSAKENKLIVDKEEVTKQLYKKTK